VYGIYLLDMMQPILDGGPALLLVEEMSVQVTPDLAPAQWSPSLFSLFCQLLDPEQTVMIQDKFQALLLLIALTGEILNFLGLRLSTSATTATNFEMGQSLETVENVLQAQQQLLEAAHSRWKRLWDSFDQVEEIPRKYSFAMPFYIVSHY
jgi:hypothetical protein